MGVTRIQHNLSAMNAMSNYQGNQNTLTGNLEKLSSGYRINSAADDAAGLAISEKMRSQIAGLEKAQDNANDGISLVQTAEGALTEVNSMLTRLKTLATQSANGTYEDGVDRANLQEETDALLSEIDRISQSTNFNGINLLDGSMSSSGIKQTDVAVNINGITMNSTASTEGKSTSYAVELSQAAGINEGDKQVYKFSFTDEQGTSKTASISFGAGSDQASTTKNMADAINKDSIMGAHFTAHVDKNNKLIIDSNITAFAADGKNITKGAASIQDISATSGGVGIASQEAVESVIVNVDQLYDKDGFKVNADAESVKAAQAKGDLYTSGPNITKDAYIDSNSVQTGITLSDEGKALTADATFTMSKKSKVSGDSSVDASKVELTDAGKNLASGSATSAITKFKFVGATNGSIDSKIATTFTVKSNSEAENLTEDTVIKYNAATADNDSGTIQSGATTLRKDTTFTFNTAKVDLNAGTSTGLGTIELTDGAEILTELGKITDKNGTKQDIASTLTSINFTYNQAIMGSGTITATSTDGSSDVTISVTSANMTDTAKALTKDSTLSYSTTSKKWTLNGKEVNISDYLDSTTISSINGTKGIKTDVSLTITAGYWNAQNGAAAANSVNVGDASRYFTTSTAAKGGETVRLDLANWTKSDEDNAAGVVVTAASMDADYFKGVTPDKGSVINVTAGYWTSSNSSLGDNGKIKDSDLTDYISFTSANKNLEGGETININAGYWQARKVVSGSEQIDSSVGTNGKVGDGSAYFTGATATSGATVVLEKTAEWTVKSEDKNIGDKDGKVENIKTYLGNISTDIDDLSEGSIKVKAAEFTMNEDDKAVEGTDYELTDGVTESKTYDLTSLNDGDRVQINGTNYTYRANEEDVKASTDFNTGSQLAGMSQAISFKADGENDLSAVTVKTQFAEGESLTLQVGDTAKDYQKVNVDIKDMSSTGLGLKGLDISTQEKAAEAIDTIQTAVNAVSTQRGKLGALQNRLDHTLNNLDATTQNITAAESQIRDVDMAKEMTQYSKNNILVQAAQSMLAQANSLPQGVLSLLQ